MLSAWLPIILLLLSAAVTITALLIVSTQRRQTKRLANDIESLSSDLSEANSNSLRLKHELDAKNQAVLNAPNPSDLSTEKENHAIALNSIKELNTVIGDKDTVITDQDGEIKKLKKQVGEETHLRESAQVKLKIKEQYDRLFTLAETQKAEIDNWVVIQKCVRGDLILNPPMGQHCKVILAIYVTNKSVLDISLSDQLGGFIKFQDANLLDGKEVINPVTDVASGETRCLTIEQRLSDSDVRMLLDAQHTMQPQFFNFDRLVVTIVGGKHSPEVVSAPLKLGLDAFVTAFPINLEERGQRIRALSEVRGSALQLHEPLRVNPNEPLPKETIERWVTFSLETLERVYKEKAAIRVWQEIAPSNPIPEAPAFQRAWLETCFINLGAMLATETGEYIRNRS